MNSDTFRPHKIGNVTVLLPGGSANITSRRDYSSYGLRPHDLDRREAVRRNQSRAVQESGTLLEHVFGRDEVTATVLNNVAYSKAKKWVDATDIVGSTGAVYRDQQGTDAFPAAHRFVCNPTIGNRDIPQLPRFSALALREEFKAPLRKTDILPVVVNEADRIFETHGASEAVLKAIRGLIYEQPSGKPVNTRLVEASILKVLLDFDRAYEKAIDESRDEPERAMLVASRELNKIYRPMASTEDKIQEHVSRLECLEALELS